MIKGQRCILTIIILQPFLVKYLLDRNSYLSGIIGLNRKNLTKTVTKSKLKRGEIVALENKNRVK